MKLHPHKFEYPIEQLAVSHSSMSMFHSCARKLEFRKFYLHTAKDNSFPGDVGHCLHDGYQKWMISKNVEEAVFAMAKAYPMEMFLFGEGHSTRSLEACYATLMAMIDSDINDRYEIAQVKCLDGEIRPAVEVPFEIAITNFKLGGKIPVIYTGFMDLILYDRLMDQYRVNDIKTHRDNARDLEPKFRHDQQCIPYGIVLESILGKEVSEFEVNYMTCYIDLTAPRIINFNFMKNKNDIQDWAKTFYSDLLNIEKWYSDQWWPRTTNGSTCLAYGRKCKFYDDCEYRDPLEIQKGFIPDGEEADTRLIDRRGEWKPWVRVNLEF